MDLWYDTLMDQWLVAVSGGCDSMTLLDLCVKNKIKVHVAHVNYQKRESAKRDEKLVKEYCEKHDIPFHVAYCSPIYEGNFQAYARTFRYDFFKQLVDEYHLSGVLVAHQKDDYFETYLIQKQRKSVPIYYGLKKETMHNGLRIVRPLLAMDKKQCYAYCFENDVLFGEDESNFSNDYLRNRLRKEVVDSWDEAKRNRVLKEIEQLNEQKQDHEAKIIDELMNIPEDLNIEQFRKTDYPMDVLRAWLYREHVGYQCSQKYLAQICQTILHNNEGYVFRIDEQTTLIKSYDVVQLVKEIAYAYTFDSLQEFECEYFALRKTGSRMQAVTLFEDDFPITIRSPKKEDKIVMRYGTKKINRFFIDKKVSHKERKCWPIVVNRMGNVIFVPEIGCDVQHYTNNANCFVVK